MHASEVWIDKLAMLVSQRCALCCWSAVFQRCRRSRRLPPVHILPPGGDPWHEQRRKFGCDLLPPSTGKMFVRPPAIPLQPGSARYSFTPSLTAVWCNYQTLYNYFFEVYSISLKRWSYHQMFKLSYEQFNSQVANHVISHSSFWLVNSLTADIYRYYDHKYVNIHRH